MMTFLTIFFVLIGINALILFFSLQKANNKTRNTSPSVSKLSDAIIYPIDLLTQEFKKAV